MYQSTSSVASFDLSKLHDPSNESKVFKQSNPSLPPMYRSSDQTKFTFSNSLRQTHLSHQTAKKQFPQVQFNSLNPLEQQAYLKPSSKQQQKDDEGLPKHRRDRSLSINIKSTNRELIESKEYENKISNDYEPIFPQFKQEESVQIDSFAKNKHQMHQKMLMVNIKSRETKNYVPISSNLKRVESKWLDDEAQQHLQSSEQELITSAELFSSSQDVEKLSQIYNQLLLKNDTKTIKQLNATNQELKAICKQIVSLLRYDPISSKRKISEDLIISKVYKIIANYEHNKNARNDAKS